MRPSYIREAHRLLQQSIIFVEMEDIELDVDDLPPPDEPTPEAPDETENTSAAIPETEMSALPETEATVQDTQKRKRESEGGKKKKAKTMISAEQYRSMTAMIAILLRTQEDLKGPEFKGVQMSEIVVWYLDQVGVGIFTVFL